MAIIAIQDIPAAGLKKTMVAAAAGGDKFLNDGRALFHVKNGSASAITVTVVAATACSHGVMHNLVINVAAGDEISLPRLDPSRFNDAGGYANITYSAAATVTVGCIRP